MKRISILLALSLGPAALAGCKPRTHEAPAAQARVTGTAAGTDFAPHAGTETELVERGRMLVTLGGCGDCHTPMAFDPKLGMPVPDMKRMLSGHPVGAPEPASEPGKGDQAVIGATFTSFRLPFGVVYARNLTPDAKTGLGAWTKEQFVATMRTGHRQGTGRVLLPPMPWQNLSQQPTAELEAMFSYLQSIPAIENAVPEPTVPAPVIEGIAKSYEAMKLAQK